MSSSVYTGSSDQLSRELKWTLNLRRFVKTLQTNKQLQHKQFIFVLCLCNACINEVFNGTLLGQVDTVVTAGHTLLTRVSCWVCVLGSASYMVMLILVLSVRVFFASFPGFSLFTTIKSVGFKFQYYLKTEYMNIAIPGMCMCFKLFYFNFTSETAWFGDPLHINRDTPISRAEGFGTDPLSVVPSDPTYWPRTDPSGYPLHS